MLSHSSSTLEDSLRGMFPHGCLRRIAKETDLIVRERKIDPIILFWFLTLVFGVHLQRTLTNLKREYKKDANNSISDHNWTVDSLFIL